MPRRSANADPTDPTPALTRGLDLLQRLGRDGPQLLERLAAVAALPKSSTLRLLTGLERLALVARDPVTRRWHARVALVARRDDEAEAARLRQVLSDLARASGHAAEAWAWDGAQVTLIDRADPEDRAEAVRARIGFARPAVELDAVMLAIFAHLPNGPAWLPRHTQSIDRRQVQVARTAVQPQLDAARQHGVVADPGTNEYGVRRFAAPWTIAGGGLRGAIALAQGGGLPIGGEDDRLLALVRDGAARLGPGRMRPG